MKLTTTQQRILKAMQQDELGFAAFTGEDSRRLGFGIIPAKYGGIIIRAYGVPQFFLKSRGLIEAVERNVPGLGATPTTIKAAPAPMRPFTGCCARHARAALPVP